MSKKTIERKKKHQQLKTNHKLKEITKKAKQELIDNPIPDFVLFFGDENNKILNGDVRVQWCLSDSLIEALNNSGIKDPHILLIATKKGSGKEMSRQLITITQLRTYVRCTKAGDITIHAWIIDGATGRRNIFDKYISKINGDCATTMVNTYDGSTLVTQKEIAHSTSENITIPPSCFGKEPNPKLKKFANLWHPSTIVDDCSFRKRLILAFALKWEAIILYTIFMVWFRLLIFVILITWGYRRIITNWKGFYKVFSLSISELLTRNYDPILCNDYTIHKSFGVEKKTTINFITFIPFTPMFVLVLGFLSWVALDKVLDINVIITLSEVLSIFVGLCFGIDIGQLIRYKLNNTNIISNISNLLNTKHDKQNTIVIVSILLLIIYAAPIHLLRVMFVIICICIILIVLSSAWIKYVINTEIHNNISDVQELKCDDCESIEFGHTARPDTSKVKRPLKLIYLETKNKMCKPMQR
jgi:hypothetical protein